MRCHEDFSMRLCQDIMRFNANEKYIICCKNIDYMLHENRLHVT